MLTKMWIGLYISLVQVVLYIIVVINHDSKYWSQYQLDANGTYNTADFNPGIVCLHIRYTYKNNSLEMIYDPVDNTYLWFIIPQLLNGLSSLLVSMNSV